jgi:hypothetical protein
MPANKPDRNQRYIITEELAKDIDTALIIGMDGTLPNRSELMDALRSNPVKKECETCEWMKRADKKEKTKVKIPNNSQKKIMFR